MNALTVHINGIEQISGAMREAILNGARSGMEKAGIEGARLVQQREPVGATSNLVQGTMAEMHSDAPMFEEVIFVAPPADVYAAPVEFGTAPHMPPVLPLVLWVQKKLHVGDEKQATSIAWAIAKSIAKRGTQGVHMFEQGFEELQGELVGIIEREIAVALEAGGFGGNA